ncbi:hypothetical protein MNBD_PLANCTO03-2447, partial [hydrothermal vent metagenome]
GTNRAHHKAALLPEQPRQAVQIFGPSGERVPWAVMLETVSGADVIVIGESHGHPLGLAAAASLWEDLLADHPDAALLMEFFERDTQVALDDYLTDITDEEAFRKAASRTKGNYPPGHAQMVEAAKEAGIPVIAANAPRRYVRKTTPEGYENLTSLGAEQQRLFTVPDALIEGRYRDDFFKVMGAAGHGADDQNTEDSEQSTEGESEKNGEDETISTEKLEKVQKFYYSMQMWDDTMADSVVRAIEDGYTPAVLVVGRFHSDFEGGTIQFIKQRHPGLDIRTLSMITSGKSDIAEDDIGAGDFVLYIGEMPSEE